MIGDGDGDCLWRDPRLHEAVQPGDQPNEAKEECGTVVTPTEVWLSMSHRVLQKEVKDSRWWRLLSPDFVLSKNLHIKTMRIGVDRKITSSDPNNDGP